MANKVVLDTSALLAVLRAEPTEACISRRIRGKEVAVAAVSASEVYQVLMEENRFTDDEARQTLEALATEIHAFDAAAAFHSAPFARAPGGRTFSVASRATLALAKYLGVVVLTTNPDWDVFEHAIIVTENS